MKTDASKEPSAKGAISQTESELAAAANLTPEQRALLMLRLRKKAQARAGHAAEAAPMPRVSRDAELPLSFAQQRLWFLEQLSLNRTAYNVNLGVRLNGQLDVAALRQTFDEILRRHESLRTVFRATDGRPVQVIKDNLTLPLTLVSVRELAPAQRELEVQRQVEDGMRHLFDLSEGPLLRTVLFELDRDEHILHLTLHHIISDGWSLGILIREIVQLYSAFSGGNPSTLPELPVQYADFAHWQRQWLTGEVLERQLSYWRRQLSDLPVLQLPTDRPRPPVQNFHGAREVITLDANLSEALKRLARQEDATLFMFLLAAFKVLLQRYTSQTDIAVGTNIANRNRVEIEGLIGFFVNTLVLRTDISGDPAFTELLARVRDVTLAAYAHQDLPFEKLVEELQPTRDLSSSPLFHVMFALLNTPQQGLEAPGLTLSPLAIENQVSKFDLTMFVLEGENGSTISLQYDTALYEAATIKRMLGHFQTLLEAIVASPGERISRLSLLTQLEREQILTLTKNSTAKPIPARCLHELFEEQVERTPQQVALVYEDHKLSYAELNNRANQLAHHLIGLGVAPEQVVGLCLERSPEMVIALLAVLKAGAAYLPLDPQYPHERLRFMIEDAGARLLLTSSQHQAMLNDLISHALPAIVVDSPTEAFNAAPVHNPATPVVPDNAAYIIYTSGSTGLPKGVVVTHANVSRLLKATEAHFHFSEQDVWTLFHSYAFDFSVWEVWGALAHGGQLVVVPYWVSRSPAALIELIEREKVTVLNQTPSAFRQLMWEEHARAGAAARQSGTEQRTERAQPLPTTSGWQPLPLRFVIFGGEALELNSLRPWLDLYGDEQPQLINMYGITETTVHVTYRRVVRVDIENSRGSLIGEAVAGWQLYVLGESMELLPEGVVGEFYVSGGGLARGYAGRAELSAERFVPHPYSEESGARLYRTGDTGRRVAGGDIEYVGRRDGQVKVRGFRIEVGEIEAILREQAEVKEAVVLLREEGGEKGLAAYVVVGGEDAWAVDELRQRVKERLPEYMVPRWFVMLDEMPLTANGKVDRRVLPSPSQGSRGINGTSVGGFTPVEEMLGGIWCEVLGLSEIERTDDFFELGGHSLLATQLMSRVQQKFGVDIPLRVLFEGPTLCSMGEEVERAMRAGERLHAPPLVPVPRSAPLPVSFAQQRLWFLHQLEPENAAYNIPLAVRLRGALKVSVLGQTLDLLVRRHEALRTYFADVDGQPVQIVSPTQSFALPLINLDELSETQREGEVRRLAEEEAERVFELEKGPLMRAQLLRLKDDEHVMLLTMHHIISDGWSMALLVRDLTTLYEALSHGKSSPLPELAIQYADFAAWQRAWLQGEVLERQLSYWKRQLMGAPPILELPTDRPRPEVRTAHGQMHALLLPKDLSEQLKALSRREGATLFMVLLAAFKVLLRSHAKQDDVVVGTDIANRNRVETENLIGFFINQLVLRTDLSGNPCFRELLARVREMTIAAYTHQDLPFEQLVESLKPERSLKHSPLFQVKLVLQNAQTELLQIPSLEISAVRHERIAARFDLTLLLSEKLEGLSGYFEYNSDLFNASTIERLGRHFELLLRRVAAEPETRIDELAQALAEMDAGEQLKEKARRAEANLRKLKFTKPKTFNLQPAQLVKLDYFAPGQLLPLIIRPAVELVDLVDWAKDRREFIEAELLKHGAILFRGFDVDAPGLLEKFASVFAPDLFNENGEHPRETVSGKVYSTVFYPPDKQLLWHNENSFNHQWPTKIWFCCTQPAVEGGETPLADSRRVYELLDPDIKKRFLEKNVMYVRNYGEGLGLHWQDVFRTSDKAQVEAHCRASLMQYEWKANDRLRTWCVRPAVVKHPQTHEMVWFNQAQHWHVSCLDWATRESVLSLYSEEDLPRHCYYGDHTKIDDAVMNEILEVYRKLEVKFPWQKGDVLMLDNLLTAHGRNAFLGTRKMLVAMGGMKSYREV